MDQKSTLKVHRIAERFWFGVFIVTSILTAWWWYTEGIETRPLAPVMPAIALVWFFVRRMVRRRFERQLHKQ